MSGHATFKKFPPKTNHPSRVLLTMGITVSTADTSNDDDHTPGRSGVGEKARGFSSGVGAFTSKSAGNRLRSSGTADVSTALPVDHSAIMTTSMMMKPNLFTLAAADDAVSKYTASTQGLSLEDAYSTSSCGANNTDGGTMSTSPPLGYCPRRLLPPCIATAAIQTVVPQPTATTSHHLGVNATTTSSSRSALDCQHLKPSTKLPVLTDSSHRKKKRYSSTSSSSSSSSAVPVQCPKSPKHQRKPKHNAATAVAAATTRRHQHDMEEEKDGPRGTSAGILLTSSRLAAKQQQDDDDADETTNSDPRLVELYNMRTWSMYNRITQARRYRPSPTATTTATVAATTATSATAATTTLHGVPTMMMMLTANHLHHHHHHAQQPATSAMPPRNGDFHNLMYGRFYSVDGTAPPQQHYSYSYSRHNQDDVDNHDDGHDLIFGDLEL
jgi:hypothetical protein